MCVRVNLHIPKGKTKQTEETKMHTTYTFKKNGKAYSAKAKYASVILRRYVEDTGDIEGVYVWD